MSSSANAAPPSFGFVRATIAKSHLLRRHNLLAITSLNSLLKSSGGTNIRLLRVSASVADAYPLNLSWLPSPSQDDNYGGWAVAEPPPSKSSNKKGLPTVLIGGIGTCVASLLAAVAYFSLSRKGYKLPFRTRGSTSIEIETIKPESIEVLDENATMPEFSEFESDAAGDTMASVSTKKPDHVKVSAVVDPMQLEAMSTLKKLKIIEDDNVAGELCSKREYARWLVRLNSLLERSSKHRIVPSVSLSGATIPAFDDVPVEDSDFQFIQALAEAGIIESKLSGTNFHSNSLEGDGSFYFYPQRFVSRHDLINWKAQLEYGFLPDIVDQMSRTKVRYMDVKDISRNASPELFIDMLAGENSIFSNVFGQSRRFQPNKPLTKAQAAVALTSGRMREAVCSEILRLEAESSSRQAAAKELKSELLDKGDIQRFWDEKIKEENSRGLETEKIYVATLHNLEQEKVVQVKTYADFLKEKAAMDCQRRILLSLKEEIDVMSETVASESATYVAEQSNIRGLLNDLLKEQEEMMDSKSIIEAEIEALRILRSWIEDEARKSQARAKVLEDVGRRWRWDNQD